MDDSRWEPGMPVLERQAVATSRVPASLRGLPPRSVPEVRPTALQRHYVSLSVIVLVCGAVAITALEFGASLASPLVKLCAIVGAPLLVLTGVDATVRIWRSAWAWLPVNPGRGLFRLAWVIAALVGLAGLVAGSLVILVA